MKGLLVNDERSLWYSRIGDFLMSVWDQKKEISCGGGSACAVGRTNLTPVCEANGIECYGSSVSELMWILFQLCSPVCFPHQNLVGYGTSVVSIGYIVTWSFPSVTWNAQYYINIGNFVTALSQVCCTSTCCKIVAHAWWFYSIPWMLVVMSNPYWVVQVVAPICLNSPKLCALIVLWASIWK